MLVSPPVISNVSHSVYKWLRTYVYKSGATAITGTLLEQFTQLTILPAYPSDLLKIKSPTLAVGTASGISTSGFFYAELRQDKIILLDLFGFVAGQGSDHSNALYLSRLMNDVAWLCDDVARHSGILLYEQGTNVEIGQLEVDQVRVRQLVESVPAVEADRYRFIVELEIPYTAEADYVP